MSSSSLDPSFIVCGYLLLAPARRGKPLCEENEENVDGVEPLLPLPWLCIERFPPPVVLARPTSLRKRLSSKACLYTGALASEPGSEVTLRGARGGKEESGLRFLTCAVRGGLYSGIEASSGGASQSLGQPRCNTPSGVRHIPFSIFSAASLSSNKSVCFSLSSLRFLGTDLALCLLPVVARLDSFRASPTIPPAKPPSALKYALSSSLLFPSIAAGDFGG